MEIPDDLRDADPSEAAALEDLQRRSALVWDDYREQLTAHPDAIELPVELIRDHQVRVASRDGRVVGFSVALPAPHRRCELDGLFVEPEFMRRGVGRALVADVVANARQQERQALEVTANPRAVGFYEKLGFRLGPTVATRFGPGHRMRLLLNEEDARVL